MPILIIGNQDITVTEKQAQQILQALREGKDIKVKNQKGIWITSRNKTVSIVKGN